MNWLIFVIIGHTFWAVCAIISKIFITKYVKNIFVYAAFVGLISFLPVLAIPFKTITLPDFHVLIIALIAGMLYVYSFLPYLKALLIEEVSRVIPIFRLTPLFVLILSFFFLGERLTDSELIAFVILFLGGLLISIHKIKDTLKISQAFYLMLLTCFILGIYNILSKWIYHHLPYYDGFILIRIGSGLGALTLLSINSFGVQLVKTFTQLPPKIKQIAVFYSLFNISGHIFVNLAIFLAPVSLVSVSGSMAPILVFLFTLLLSQKYPHILKENTTKALLLQKSAAIFLIIIGTSFLFF